MLGLSRSADSEAVRRTYNRLVRENKDDDAAMARIETAHSAIMMSQLNARMKVPCMLREPPSSTPTGRSLAIICSVYAQGKLEVGKDVKYADKAVYFPWRPRYLALHCLQCLKREPQKPDPFSCHDGLCRTLLPGEQSTAVDTGQAC